MTNQKLHIFQGLLSVATLRGQTGAGFAGVPSLPGKLDILRDPYITASELAYGNDVWSLLHGKQAKKYNCLMGHARMPTSGGFELEDCHPHESRHVIGMHNGTMKKVMGKKVKNSENDSKLLIEAIGTHGIQKVLADSEGDYALVIYDKNQSRLFFARNTGRPLHIAQVDGDVNTMYWASEAAMLQLVIGRSIVNPRSIKHYTVQPNKLLSYRVFFPSAVEYENYGPITQTKKSDEKDEDQKLFWYPTFGSVTCRYEDLKKLLDSGCANCQEPATVEDYTTKKITWFRPNEFMCEKCLSEDALARGYMKSCGVSVPDHIQINPASIMH